jgi:hypothetical protein
VFGRLIIPRLGRSATALDEIGANAQLFSGDFSAGHCCPPIDLLTLHIKDVSRALGKGDIERGPASCCSEMNRAMYANKFAVNSTVEDRKQICVKTQRWKT